MGDLKILLAFLLIMEILAFVIFLICFLWSDNEIFFAKLLASDVITGVATVVFLKLDEPYK